MSDSHFSILLVAALFGATTVQALTPAVQAVPSELSFGVQVVQSTATVLSDSDIRRVNHYSARVLKALQALDTPDADVAGLRADVQRLVGAGDRSGMDIANTALYFEAYLAENNDTPLPGALLDALGQFDARSLFTATILHFESNAGQTVDIAAIDAADLAAIGSVAQQVAPQAPVQQTLQLSFTVIPDVVIEAPVIAPNAPANVRAILERVVIRGNDWVITVERGDSLGQYANALYGDTLNFQRIYQANLSVLATPNSITVGQELVLPKS